MPMIGDINVPDDFTPTTVATTTGRPGLGAIFGGALKQAYGQVRYGLPYAAEKSLGTAGPGDEAFYQKGLADTSVAANAAPPSSFDDLRAGKVGFGRFVLENLAASGPQTLSSIAGGVVGARLGGVEGALGGTIGTVAPQFVGSNVARAVQETGTLTESAANRAIFTAPFQAASDALVERYLPGAGHVIGDFAAHQTGNFLARTAKSIVKAGATEAVAEAGQQLGERFSAGLDVTGPQAAAEYVNAAATAFAVGGVLGAGGGIRRMDAHTKPAAEVTPENLNAAIDAALAPKPALTPVQNPTYQPPQLALTDQRVQAPIIAGADGVSVTPEQQAAGLDPSVLAQPAPSADGVAARLAAQSQAVGEEPARIGSAVRDILAGNGPKPEVPEALRAAAPAFDPAAALQDRINQGQASALAIDASRSDVNGVASDAQPRLFANEPIADLHAALAAKTATPEVKAEAEREVSQRVAEATGAAPLTTDNFQTRVDDVKAGLRNQFTQKLTATSPADLMGKVYDRVLVDQDTSATTVKLAQRLGILDADLKPTAAADAIEAQRTATAVAEATPTPPVPEAVSIAPQVVDQAFGAQWNQLKSQAGVSRTSAALKDAGLDAAPPNLQSAQTQVFRALADDKSSAATSQVEKLAQKMGLITDDDARDITPLGRKAYLGTPEGTQDVATAAIDQGYSGPQAATFTSGVQAALTGNEATGHTSFEDMAAYQAGKVFAQDFIASPGTKTLAQTTAIQSRQSARATGKTVDREQVKGSSLTPGQIQTRGLNNLIDAADLRTVSDSDVAMLRKMARDGASPTEVGQALQQVQGGKTLFQQPAATTATLPGLPTRGQPIFKEMNTAADRTPSKAQSRVESEAAVRAFAQRDLIRQALVDKEITVSRADRLNDMLDRGNVAAVERVTADFGSIGREAHGSFLSSAYVLGESDSQFEQFITGKSFADTAKYMMDHAPSPAYRALMEKVQALGARVTDAGGHAFEIKIVGPGDLAPADLANPDVRAYTQISRVPAKATIWLKSAEMGPESGTNYQLAAHEMLHAVTMQAVEYAENTDPQGKTPLGKAVKDLTDLSLAVVQHLNDRLDNGDRMTHTPFELGAALGEHNAFADPHEILAWGLTNPHMQQYLQSIQYAPRESVFSRFVNLVREVLGLKGQKYDTALTELLRVSEQILGTGARDLAPAFVRDNPNGADTAVLSASARAGGFGAAARTVGSANDVTQQVASTIADAAEKLKVVDLSGKARRTGLYIMSQNHMDREFGHYVPSLIQRSDAKRAHDAVRGRFASMGDAAYQRFEVLQRTSADQAKRLVRLMDVTTAHRIDPDKVFEDHAHFGFTRNADGTITPAKGQSESVAKLRTLYDTVQKMKQDLQRGNDGEGYKTYQEFRQRNEGMNYARLATELHALVALDPELTLGVAGAAVNPMDTFMAQANLSTPTAIRDHWQSALQDQLKAAQQFVTAKKGEAATGTESDVRGMNQHLAPIEDKIAQTYEALRGMARAPYFHLGRFGDNFGSATIRKNADGTVDLKAQKHVAEALDAAGFKNVQISADNTRPKFAARFETVAATDRFRELMQALHNQGWLDGELHDIQAGPRDLQTNFGVADGLPEFLNRQIQAIETDHRYQPSDGMTEAERQALEAKKQETVQIVRDAWLEQQPDSAISKVLTERYTVPGYDPDMMRSFAHRWTVGSTSLANTATRAAASNAIKDMRAQLNDARRADSQEDPNLISDVLTEVLKRDAMNPVNQTSGAFGKILSASHAYYLGLSPAYGAIQLMQIGTNGLPELAKNHGYAKSFSAIRRAATAAFAVMRAATSEAAKGGAAHYADVALTEPALQRAGLSKTQTDFLRRMIATGSLDIGQSANALHQIAREGTSSKLDVALKYASAIGLHTETFSRLVVALAAHELHGGDDIAAKAAYAQNVVSNSMFDYQSWNSARALGKQGFAGPVTPLLTQFMSYSAQMTEKLYSEAASAIGRARPGETEEQTAERARAARTFLVGHLTAITALAGTLGLPFASVFATAIERIVGGFQGPGEPPYDATAAWRNFLADVLGKDTAEVVARGAPRALGFDISTRVGESDLLPFSKLLGDRRSWRESIQSTLGRSTGAAPDMLLNLADAGTAFGNGDVLGGMKAMLPVAFKGPTEAYRMSSQGYIDTKGNKLPMTPTASAILYQLLGFTPAEKAEYSEARGDQQSRRVGLNSEAGALRSRIVKALTSGDTAGAKELITKAQAFDTANPAFAVIPSLQGAVQRQAESQARARATKTPLGVPMQDIAGRHLTGYANVNYQ